MIKKVYPRHEIYFKAIELLNFLSKEKVSELTQKFNKCTSHGEFYSESMLRIFHPWIDGILDLKEYNPKPIVPGSFEDMPNSILKMGTDATVLLPILNDPTLTENVKAEFRSRLADRNLAFDTLFELRTAGHLRKLSSLNWLANNIRGKKPEFFFNWKNNRTFVECKIIREESGRDFSNESFAYLVQKLLDLLTLKNLSGLIHIKPITKLPSSHNELDLMVQEFSKLISIELDSSCILQQRIEVEFQLKQFSSIIVPVNISKDILLESQKENALLSAVHRTDTSRPTVVSISLENQKLLSDLILEKISSARKKISDQDTGLILVGIQSRRPEDLLSLKHDLPFNDAIKLKLQKPQYQNIFGVQLMTDDIATDYSLGALDMGTRYGLKIKNDTFKNQDFEDFPFGDWEEK